MLIIYRDGEVQNRIVAWGGDRERRLEGQSGCTDLPTIFVFMGCFRTGGRVGPMWCDYTYSSSWG
jgi:hypothetical protein